MKLTEHQLELVKTALHNQAAHLVPRITPVYGLLGWKWAEVGVPSEDAISEEMHRLIDDIEGFGKRSTGGLYVSCKPDGEGGVNAFVGMEIDEIAWLTISIPVEDGEA